MASYVQSSLPPGSPSATGAGGRPSLSGPLRTPIARCAGVWLLRLDANQESIISQVIDSPVPTTLRLVSLRLDLV